MRRIAVFIATTAGPVAIERITLEPAARASMVCLGRSARQLPLSDDYDSFVAPGVGAVARAFGPFDAGGFRMDLAAPLSSGDSWQLAAFVAHAVLADPAAELTGDADDADVVLWLTGAVDYDYAVQPVEHVAEKLHAAEAALTGWSAAGRQVVLLLPAGANHDLAGQLLGGGWDCRAVASALDACAALDLRCPAPATAPGPAVRGAGGRRWFGLAALAVLLLVALLLWRSVADDDAAPGPVASQPALTLELTARRAPAGSGCVAVLFGDGVPRIGPVRGTLRDLCGIDAVLAVGDGPRFVAADLIDLHGGLLPRERPPAPLDGAVAAAGPWRWSFDLPRRSPDGQAFLFLAVAGAGPVDAAWRRLRAAEDVEAAAGELRRDGLEVTVERVVLEP